VRNSRAIEKRAEKPPITIIDACRDRDIFGPWFKDASTWVAWFALLKCMFGLSLTDDELSIFRKHTGRTAPAPGCYYDVTLVVGRRGGKSLVLALIAAFLACFFDWRPFLTGGENGVIMIIAADRRQAATIFKYLREMLSIPLLNGIIVRETNELLELNNSITIEIQTASFRTVRGRTVVAALADELAFWQNSEATANPDNEIIAALKPSMATVPGARLLKASSPYARRGVLWNDYRKHYGNDDSRTLVWKATTREMNPSVPQAFIDDQYADDPASAGAEYGAEFRSDVEAFLSREAVDAVTPRGRLELMPVTGLDYVGFVDPSGGSADSMTLAIGHMDDDVAVLDLVREVRPPFSPESVVEEFSRILKAYRISRVIGDRYGGEWPRERFRVNGIEYRCSEKAKSDLYQGLLPLINSGRCELLDQPRLIGQLCSLERRTARGGRDSIDHPPNAHDDIANCAAGALVNVQKAAPKLFFGAVPFAASQPHSFPCSDSNFTSAPPGGWPRT
jgi:hypothetical protein